MQHQRRARLGNRSMLRWLVDPTTNVPADTRPILLGSLLSAPGVVLIGALSGIFIAVAAALRTGSPRFWVFAAIEVVLVLLRLRAIRRSERHFRAGTLPTVDRSVLLTIGWCTLQGITGFAIARTGDLAMIVIATAFILGLVAPICARNHAAPRLAVLLVMLCDLPLKIGLAFSGHPVLWMLIPLCFPLFASICVLLRNVAAIMADSFNAAERNRFLAGHDALTGLANRYGLDERIAAMAVRPLALLCLDLDRFKSINDRYGHGAGDAVLVAVAARLRDAAGDAALIVRLGGDEFLLAVPDLDPVRAEALGQQIAAAITDCKIALADGDHVAIGTSIGYACFPEDATSVTALRTNADDALYAAKRGGGGVRRHRAPETLPDAA
jgi:diguanylate cyclase (GGDEF)-like protein